MFTFLSLFAFDLTPQYHFENVSINYLDWTPYTKTKTIDNDFFYAGFEGGAGWKYAEIYGFLYTENPTKSYDASGESLRFVNLVDLDLKIKNGFRIHLQNYHLDSSSYYTNDFVLGIGYKYVSKSFWIRPFLGIHTTNDTFNNGLNGYMAGWLFSYNFSIQQRIFNVFWWDEFEFGREARFYKNSDKASWGNQGGVSLFYFLNKPFTLGITYRYSYHKLGVYTYQDAFIYSFKFNF